MRRQGAGLFRGRDHRGSDDRSLASARQLRHRPQYRFHLQGQAGRRRRKSGKRTWRALCLEGSVRRVGETITINAQLISTETGAHVWADRFEGGRASSASCRSRPYPVSPIRLGWTRQGRSLAGDARAAEEPGRRRPHDARLDLLNSNPGKAGLQDALSLFERALALDPQNVSAMLGLNDDLVALLDNYFSDDRAGDIARAEETIDRALTLRA